MVRLFLVNCWRVVDHLHEGVVRSVHIGGIQPDHAPPARIGSMKLYVVVWFHGRCPLDSYFPLRSMVLLSTSAQPTSLILIVVNFLPLQARVVGGFKLHIIRFLVDHLQLSLGAPCFGRLGQLSHELADLQAEFLHRLRS
jgi:hypothetical protein